VPNILVDTGLWYALFDTKDSYHEQAQETAERLAPLTIVIPWPVLYETLSTSFAPNFRALRRFEMFLKRPGVVFLDDTPYRQEALNRVFEWSLQHSRPLSATDCVLRLILDDVAIRIDLLATFNVRDFADVCRRRGVELL